MLAILCRKKTSIGRRLLLIILALLTACTGFFAGIPKTVSAAGETILIEPTSWGVVTQKELDSFKAVVRTFPLPEDNIGNKMVWGYGNAGANTEALGMMYELTGDVELLDMMIKFVDSMLRYRNDPETGHIIFTGKRELCWPNSDDPTTMGSAGTENGTIIMHIADCAKLILKTPALWDKSVAVGDPYGYGETYKERALKYIEECDKTMEEFLLPNFVKEVGGVPKLYFPDTDEFRAVKGSTPDHPGRYIMWNQQMLLNNGFMSLAECHELLGDKPEMVAYYDEIVNVSVNAFMDDLRPYEKDGHPVYTWDYWPGGLSKVEEAGGAHAAYDNIGLYRAYLRGKYGVPAAVLTNIAKTINYVVWDEGKQQFHFKVDGTTPSGKSMRTVLWSELIVTSEFNQDCYDKIVNDDWMDTAKTTPIFAAWTFWMENRMRELGFTPPVPPPKAITPPTLKPDNLAINKVYETSSYWKNDVRYNADKAFDGNDSSTRWSADRDQSTDQWICVDFGVPTTFNNVVLKEFMSPTEEKSRIQSYKLQRWDDDAQDYVDIPGTEGTSIGKEKDLYFTPVTSNGLRLYIESALKEPGLWEFEVYDNKAQTIHPSETIFDKNRDASGVIMFWVKPEGKTLTGITNNSYTLVADQDYTTEAKNDANILFTLTNSYLKSLDAGGYTLEFEFSEGDTAVLSLSIVDTSPIISISGDTSYDKNGGETSNIPVTVIHSGNVLTGIWCGGYLLKENQHYTYVEQDENSAIYNIDRMSLPLGHHVLIFDFDCGIDPTLEVEIYDTSLLFNVNLTEFDKNPIRQTDIEIAVLKQAGMLSRIVYGESLLTVDRDFTVIEGEHSSIYIIKKEFLASLPIGENEFSLHFDTGEEKIFRLNVKDTMPPISVNAAGYDKSNRVIRKGDIFIEINTRDRDLQAIMYSSGELVENESYSIMSNNNGTICKIKKDYLELLPKGEHIFVFKFSEGEDSTLKINIKDSTPILSTSSIAFNKKDEEIPYKTKVTINTAERSLKDIRFDRELLEAGEDYTIEGNGIYFSNSFLAALPLGFNSVVFGFDTDETANLTIEVYDTTISPIFNIKLAEFDKNEDSQEDVFITAYTKDINRITTDSKLLVNLVDYVGIKRNTIATYNLKKEFLASLPLGKNTIYFKKDDANVVDILTVNVIDTTPIDKSKLQSKVDEIRESLIDAEKGSEYTAESWETLILAYNAAGEVLANEAATAEEVAVALELLNNAFKSLEKVGGGGKGKAKMTMKTGMMKGSITNNR